MAAGDIFNAKLTVTSSAATLDTLAGTGAKTYAYVRLRATAGSVVIGNASVTQANGPQLAQIQEMVINSGTIIGANINLIGPGTVEFFGITSA